MLLYGVECVDWVFRLEFEGRWPIVGLAAAIAWIVGRPFWTAVGRGWKFCTTFTGSAAGMTCGGICKHAMIVNSTPI
jgi:hypothetical protein